MSGLFKKNGFSGKDIIPFEEFRLMLDKTDEIKFDKDKAEAIVRSAEKSLAEAPIPTVLPASQFKMFWETGNRMIWERPYHQRRARLLVFAFAEAYRGEGRYIDGILDYLFAIFEESTWVIPAHQFNIPTAKGNIFPLVVKEGVMHGIDLFSATTASTLATVYYLVGDRLDEISPIVGERLRYEIEKRITQPFLQLKFGWSGALGGKVGNWCPWIVSNILFVCAVLEKNLERRRAISELCMEYLDNFTAQVPSDGGCDEGPHYWSKSTGAYYDSAELLYDMSGGKIDIFGEELLRNMCEFEAKFFIDRDNYLNFADSGPKNKNDAALIRRMGERLGSELLVSFSETVANYNRLSVEANHGYRVYRHMHERNIAADGSRGLTKVWLPELKVMIARECPETSKGIFLALKGGNNDENHNHNDLGNLIVYYDGNPVFIDAGSGEYTKDTFSDKRYTLWNTQSHYHNTITVGGVMQRNGAQYESAEEAYDEESGRLSMELKNAYPEEAGVKSLVRSAALSDGRITVTDSVRLDSPKEIDIHFLTANEPVIEDGKIALAEGRTLIYDKKLTPEIEVLEVDSAFAGRWGSNQLYCIRLKATVCEDTFTNYIQ